MAVSDKENKNIKINKSSKELILDCSEIVNSDHILNKDSLSENHKKKEVLNIKFAKEKKISNVCKIKKTLENKTRQEDLDNCKVEDDMGKKEKKNQCDNIKIKNKEKINSKERKTNESFKKVDKKFDNEDIKSYDNKHKPHYNKFPSNDNYTTQPIHPNQTTNSTTPTNDNKAKLFYLNEDFLSEDFRVKTNEICVDIVSYVCHCGGHQIEPPHSKASRMMRYLVDDLLQNRNSFMKVMAQNIEQTALTQPSELERVVNDLADEMFADGVISWNCVVTFVAFSSYLARYYKLLYRWQHVEEMIANVVSKVLTFKLGLWIVTHGGWTSFEKQFPTFCMLDFSSIWKLILLLLLVLFSVVVFYNFVHKLDRSNPYS